MTRAFLFPAFPARGLPLLILLALAAACDEGSPASPTFEGQAAGSGSGAGSDGGPDAEPEASADAG